MDLEPLDVAALINPIACNAFAMRYESRRDLSKAFTVTPSEYSVRLDETTSCQVCDADMLVAPYVKILTPLPTWAAAQLLLARLSLRVDGEQVIKDESVERFLVRPPLSGMSIHGAEVKVSVGLKTEKDLLGTCPIKFLPNGTRIELQVERFPQYAGEVELIMGVILFRYTTKARQGCLFGAGKLVDHSSGKPLGSTDLPFRNGGPESASPIERTWRGDEASAPLDSVSLDQQRAQLLGQALREEQRVRQARLETEQSLLEVKAELARAKAARLDPPPPPPPPPKPKMFMGAADWNPLDEQLARARSRLIRWGIFATGAMVAAAAGILMAYKFLKGLP